MDNTENNNQPKIDSKPVDTKIIETYADDMARVIEDDKDGLIKKIIHQDEEHEAEKRDKSPEAKKNKIFVVLGMVLIASTLAIFSIAISKQRPRTVAIDPQASPLIFTDKNIFLEVAEFSKEKIAETLATETKRADIKTGELEGVYLTEGNKVVGLKRFLEIIKGDYVLPTGLTGQETLVSDNFLVGVVDNGKQREFFILLKTKSMTDIFASLRTWENKMFSNLYQIFGEKISGEADLLTKNFTDGLVGNKNARILYKNDGGIALMYVYVNDNSVVITKDIAAARELISRLTSSKIKK